MTKLPTSKFQALVPRMREEGFYNHKEIRAINWHEYNASQTGEAKEIMCSIEEAIAKCQLFKSKGAGRPLTNPKTLAKAILLCELMHFQERRAEGWMGIIGKFIGINEHLDDRVIGEAYNNPKVLHVLKQIFEFTKSSDGKLSGDGTGLETSRKQNHESGKNASGYMTAIVDNREIVQAFEIDNRDENGAMRRLVETVEGNSLRLDAKFVDRELVDKIADKKIVPYIFPKKNIRLNGSAAWRSMYLSLYYDVMKWLEEYYQRTHSESFFSSFKRRNDIVMKRRATARLSQITARIILHNMRRLSYFNKING